MDVSRRSLALISLCALAGACRGGRVFVAPPVVTPQAQIKLLAAKAAKNRVAMNIMVENTGSEFLAFNLNQVGLVGPGNVALFPKVKAATHAIGPGRKKNFKLQIDVPAPENAARWRGAYVRFDGVLAGERPIALPAMVLGNPDWQLGAIASAPPASGTDAAVEKSATAVGAAIGAFAQAFRGGTTEATAPASGGGLSRYQGPYHQIRNAGLKCAAMPLQAHEMPEVYQAIMDEILLTELQNSGFEAIGPSDIDALIGFDKMQDAVGCEETSCIVEIGNALGVEYLAAGKVAQVEGSVIVSLKLLAVRDAKVLARASEMSTAGKQEVPRLIGVAVQKLIAQSQL